MSEWRDGFVRAATTWVVKNGHPAVIDGRFRSSELLDVYAPFGFRDERDTITAHLESCGVDYERSGKVRGFEWSEFEDTESTNSEHHGIGVDVVCECGNVNRVFVVETNFSDMLMGILSEEES